MKKKWRSWLLLAAPYLLTALIPVISVLFLGNTILNDHEKQMIAYNQSNLQISFERMQQKLDTVEELSVMLAGSDVLSRYSAACLRQAGHTPLDYMEVQSLFSNAAINPVIHDIYLYDSKDNVAISVVSALSDIEVFHRYYYIVDNMTLQESMVRLQQLGNQQRYCPEISLALPAISGSSKQIVEYRLFLPLGWMKNMQSQLVIAMDAKILFEDLQNAVTEQGEFYVYDSNDTLIYSKGNQYRDLLGLKDSDQLQLLQEDLYGAALKSGDWTVKAFIPELLEGTNPPFLSPAFALCVVLPMLACVLLTIVLTHKNYRRILELVDLFRGHAPEDNQEPRIVDYRLVQRYAGQVLEERDRMTRQITKYTHSRKYEVLDKLVRNTYRSREELAQALEEVDMAVQEGRSIALCIRCSETSYSALVSGDTTVRETIGQLIGEVLEQPYVLFDTATDEITCIISLEEDDNPEFLIQGIISQLNIELTYRHGIEVHMGAGNEVPSLYRIHESYNQACQVLYYSEAYGATIHLYSELARIEDAYYFPRDYDERICNYIIAGREAEAKGLIQEIYAENFDRDNRIPSARAIEKLKRRLWDCVTTLTEKYEITLEQTLEQTQKQLMADASRSKRSGRRYFDTVEQALDFLADEIRGKRKQVQNNAVPRIMEYVQENFCNSDLTVKQIATVFGMHENYVSYIFKCACGENLSLYIERLRIEKARDMICNTDMKIRDIAESVGYISDTSFRRSFKKITGLTPSECREQ